MRSLALFPLVLIATPSLAEEAPPADGGDAVAVDEGTGDEIVVLATRLRGQVETDQPPVITLEEGDIASYGASSLPDLIAQLSPQTGSGRGRGGGFPVILLNGQRISGFREMRNIPPEAIRRMEVLPEEVAQRYGFPPNQRVINFILKDNFSAASASGEYNIPTRGGFAETEFEATLLKINKASRFNISIEALDASMLTEAERGVIQSPGSLPGVAGDPDPAASRSLVADSRNLSLNVTWATGLGENGRDGQFSLNGAITRADSRSLSGLDVVELTAPGGASLLRSLPDPLERTSRTVTAQGGASLNKPLGAWQLTATVDASHSETDTRIDRRADTAALVAAAASGALAIDAVLPALRDAGADQALTTSESMTSLVTLAGAPFRLPAGEANVTIKAGFAYTGIDSSDTRAAGIGETSLRRGDLSTGINLGLPIASRGEGVLAGIGDLSLNLSAGLNRLSDFGTLTDWSTGLTWSPFEKLGLQASYIVNEAAPALTDLGNPQTVTLNVPVYDFTRGETVLVTVAGGGNPALVREKQRDLKIGANWELPVLRNSNLIVEYFRNRSTDVTASFPLLTPAIEAAFPGRVQRDASGQLVSIDRRPVTFAEQSGERIRYGFNLSGPLGKPQQGAAQGGGMGGGMGRPGAGGPPSGAPPRMGGGGMGGGMRGGPMGGGNGQGRWNISLYHTVRLSEQVIVAPGGPVLDLLDGDALSGGGVARHALEAEGGMFYRGFGLRFNGNWSAPTRVRASGAPGTSDLRFGSVFRLDLRLFADLGQRASLVKAVPFFKGARLAVQIDNVFDSRQRVTDASGAVPLGYQADYMDPRGRFIGLDFRKMF